jgi:hypothetical protein
MPDLVGHLAELRPAPAASGWPPLLERVYLGDEFCLHRMPKAVEFDALLAMAAACDLKPTLLTPPLTDAGISTCRNLFDRLYAHDPQAEVVANDWGVLLFLKHAYPTFRLAAGRLLDKGFKDPRLDVSKTTDPSSADLGDLFSQSTFDIPPLRKKLVELGVSRQERDLRPHGPLPAMETRDLAAACYFPFAAITTGRVCWPATFSQSSPRRITIASTCSRPCRRFFPCLIHGDLDLTLYQDGNTVFFRHPPQVLSRLLETADGKEVRLVYQGLAIQTP